MRAYSWSVITVTVIAAFYLAVSAAERPKDRLDSAFRTLELSPTKIFLPQDLVITNGVEKTASLRDFTGQKLIVQFWALSCAECKTGWQDTKALAKAASQKQIAFIVVDLDTPDREIEAKQYFSGVAGQLPYWIAAPGSSRNQYLRYGLPLTYFVQPNGLAVARAVGPRSWASREDLPGLLARVFLKKE